MGCMSLPSSSTHLTVHTVVERPLTQDDCGRITCLPTGREPIVYDWTPAPLSVDRTGSEARVTPGRYRVVACDANEARAEVVIDVVPFFEAAVIVESYKTTSASTPRSRDGSVQAVGLGVEQCNFLWSNGVETQGPTLKDVPSGRYAAYAMDPETQPVVHKCAPARVGTVSSS